MIFYFARVYVGYFKPRAARHAHFYYKLSLVHLRHELLVKRYKKKEAQEKQPQSSQKPFLFIFQEFYKILFVDLE